MNIYDQWWLKMQTREEFIADLNELLKTHPDTMQNLLAVAEDVHHPFYPFKVDRVDGMIQKVE